MTQAERTKVKGNSKALNRNKRPPAQSKLNRRTHSYSQKEQRRILKYYRDRGVAYGSGTR